ncbi:MAG: hypothetical protein KJ914_07865 [Gammaproteobacteria bacterium]|nr:hypothetical protein [Gammaproteobacteria bacterium]
MKSRLRPLLTTLLLVSPLLLSACAPLATAPDSSALKQAYDNAVKDAEQVEPDEISTQLTAITPDNPRLVWQQKNTPNAQLLVATWTNYNGYDDKLRQSVRVSREVWVTAAPELKEFCQQIRGDKTLRMEQRLGLPPNSGKTKVVEMWVKPEDLFRPSPDPEISDREAGADFPTSSRFMSISPAYRNWFKQQQEKSYGSNGYPWTRLGYTYDWGNTSNPVGLSEFVIAKGAAVEIKGVTPTAQYCQ